MKKQTTTYGPTGLGWARSLFNFRHQNPVARLVSILVAFTTAALLAIVGFGTPAVAASPCPIPGNFEIDGDMTLHTCTPSGDDWNTPTLDVTQTTQGGTYSTAGKDGGDTSTWVSSGSTPDKTNFERAYAAARNVDVGGGVLHYFVYVGWDRTDTAGTQGYAIEINGTAPHTALDGTPQPDRSNGTAVVYVSSVGSSAPTFDSACTFTSQADYGDTCTNVANANVTIAINTSSIVDPLNNNTTQVAGSFFEVAIDVTGLTGITPSCPGAAANSVYLRSVTGQTKNGNLKGYMAPLEVAPDSTCVTPPMSTTATPGGSQVAPGAAQHDDVTVGTAQAPGVGSVKFYLCAPAAVTSNGGDCSANGTLVSTQTLDANGQASSDAINGSTTPNDNATGKYCWRAEFTPGANDHHYLAGSHTNSTTECFTVVHASPTITTQIAVTGANSPGLGFTTLGDTATLHDFVPGTVTGGTVTFKLYDVTADPGCTGSVVFQTTGTLNASGVATTSATYDPTAAHTYTWIASYGGNSFNDAVAGTCADANESATIVGAQIDVAKSANPPGPVSAGETIGFDITVSNAGAVPATGVTVSDNLPAKANAAASGDLSWSLSPSYTGCSITGAVGSQVLSCSLGTVAGSSSLPAIHVQSATTPVDCGVVSNKATVATTNGTGGDSDIANVTVQCPGLSLTKTADAASVSAGSQIGFTVTASNSSAAGTGTASGVVIDDPLPAGSGVDWSIASGPANCSITGSVGSEVLHCTAVSLAPGASESVHVVSGTAYASCKAYPNTATVTATNNPTLTADATTTVLCPDLSITKTADAASVDAGSQIGFTVTASNSDTEGTGGATDVSIDDPLPSGTGVSWSILSGPENCSIQGSAPSQTLHCSPIPLAPGASESVHVVSGTAFASCKAYPNTASLAATNHPSLTASATTTVLCPDLSITKTADAASVNAGQQIGFTVTARNSDAEGTGSAAGVAISDPLPTGSGVAWTVQSSTGPLACAITSGTLSCTGTLAAGATQTVHVVSGTTTASCQAYPNTASLTATNHPSLTASATTSVANCVIVSPPSPPEQQHPNVLPNTGGPDRWAFPAGLALLLAGSALVLGDRRRRHRS